ncbi:MAG: CHAT domain-containing protein [Candidatus Eisenbacteria bacterium]|uniref:CHAT domain-containing protein n=1 Tax=Eiseniibacteriota bacterium TaxID=2212470 RepID=A0A7Y2H3V6_UNCEI|nr:CHAT domain-containing protein [Candidatus Eisenbacteria bacterium]
MLIEHGEQELAQNPKQTKDLCSALRTSTLLGAETICRVLRLEAHALKGLDRHEEAESKYRQSRECFSKQKLPLEVARTDIGRIDCLMYLDRYDEAQKVGAGAFQVFKKSGELQRAGRVLLNLGNLEYRRNRPKEALQLYRDAESFLKRAKAPAFDLAFVSHNLGNIYLDLHDPGASQSNFENSRKQAIRAKHRLLELHADYSLAGLQAARGNFRHALIGLERCENDFAALGNARAVNNCLLDRAEIYRGLHMFGATETAASKAQRGFGRLNLKMDQARALLLLGTAQIRLGQSKRGPANLRKAEQIFGELGNPAQVGVVALRESQALDSLEWSRRASLAKAKQVFQETGFVVLALEAALEQGNLYLQHDRLDELGRLNEDLRNQSALRSLPNLAARAMHLQAMHAHLSPGKTSASRLAKRALSNLERAREQLGEAEMVGAHLSHLRNLYQDLQRIFLESPGLRLPTLFEVINRFDETLLSGASQTKDSAETKKLRSQLRLKTSQVHARFPDRLKTVDTEADLRQLRRLERAFAEAKRRESLARIKKKKPETHPTLGALQERLKDSDLWIQAIDRGDSLTPLLVTKSKAVLGRPLSKEAIGRQLRGLKSQVDQYHLNPEFTAQNLDRMRISAERKLASLGDLILKPMESHLEACTRVWVKAGAGLELFPWGAMMQEKIPLWETHAVSVAPSATWFLETRAPAGQRWAKRPMFWGTSEPDLPATGREAKRLSRKLSGSQLFAGSKATVQSFLENAGQATLIHFAGHGEFRRDNPRFSSLKFQDDALLVMDLENAPLKADLVVLSACETAASKDELTLSSGHLLGFLSRAGRGLISSQWRVGDKDSAKFMTMLYEHLEAGVCPGMAVANTAIALRKRGDHPASWASFTTSGHVF